MASFTDTHIKQLQSLVTCGICSDFYRDPRTLPCLHTYCFQCISKAIVDGIFHCPLQDNTEIDQKSIADLPINQTMQLMLEFASNINLSNGKDSNQQCNNCNENPAINWCEKCASHLCESCTQSIHSSRIFQSHSLVPSTEQISLFCVEHTDEKYKYWCRKCSVLVCRDCLLFQHKDHTFAPLKDAAFDATTKLQDITQEIAVMKANLKTCSERTKQISMEYDELIDEELQNIEQTSAYLEQMLQQRKLALITELNGKRSQVNRFFHTQQNRVDEHLQLTSVQELCLIKLLHTNNPIQILKFQSFLADVFPYFLRQRKQIDQAYPVIKYEFNKNDDDVNQITTLISKLGQITSQSFTVDRKMSSMRITSFDISKTDGEIKFTEKYINYARGYRFLLTKSIDLHAIRVQSDYIGTHTACILDDTGAIIASGTGNSNDSTMKWLTIPIEFDMKNGYTVLIWAPSGKGSYACKMGTRPCRMITQDCSVESKCAASLRSTNLGTEVAIEDNLYCISMMLDIE